MVINKYFPHHTWDSDGIKCFCKWTQMNPIYDSLIEGVTMVRPLCKYATFLVLLEFGVNSLICMPFCGLY